MYVFIYICICICAYIYIYIYICMYVFLFLNSATIRNISDIDLYNTSMHWSLYMILPDVSEFLYIYIHTYTEMFYAHELYGNVGEGGQHESLAEAPPPLVL